MLFRSAEIKEKGSEITNTPQNENKGTRGENGERSVPSSSPDSGLPMSAPVPDTWDTLLAAIPPSATNNQTRNVETNTTVQNMTINAPGADAQDIMQNAATALQQVSASLNVTAADGGVI